MYVQKGVELEWEDLRWVLQTDYIDVPITLRIASEQRQLTPYVFVGPNVGIAVRSEAEFLTDDWSFELDTPPLDFSIDMGGGLTIPLNTSASLETEFRYSLGIANVSESMEPSSQRHRTYVFMFGVMVQL